MNYKVESVTTQTGNVITIKIYQWRGWPYLGYWKFLCNQSSFDLAKVTVENLTLINKGSAIKKAKANL